MKGNVEVVFNFVPNTDFMTIPPSPGIGQVINRFIIQAIKTNTTTELISNLLILLNKLYDCQIKNKVAIESSIFFIIDAFIRKFVLPYS